MNKEINAYVCERRDTLDNKIQKLIHIYNSASCNYVDGLVLNIREVQAELIHLEKEIKEKNIVCLRRS